MSIATATARQSGERLRARRLIVLGLNIGTIAILAWSMFSILSTSGLTLLECGMLIAFVATLPWLSLGFWNATIGLVISLFTRHPACFVTPAWAHADTPTPIMTRTALTVAIRNEQPGAVVARLQAMQQGLDATGYGEFFDYHILSDTSRPEIACEEQRLVEQWRDRLGGRSRVFYRRRETNTGFKAGNIRDFCESHKHVYDFFVPLDADSFMSAATILRYVRCMQANPEIGILQGLIVGAPASSFFARVFQFGMRQGMRSYTTGSNWWMGDSGPFWGHNAVIRLKPFLDHCRLPVLPGRSPLSGHILSHDLLEAVLMRRAGYEVRVVAEECESFEENPPSLLDFIKRDLRWCHGNLQYLRLLSMPGLHGLGRLHLLMAVLMYASAPAWILFILLGAVQSLMPVGFESFPIGAGVVLFATTMSMSLMPKIAGLIDVARSPAHRARYGGFGALAAGGLVEIVFTALLAPIASFAIAAFIASIWTGGGTSWSAQYRSRDNVPWSDAFAALWPQTLFGVAVTGVLALNSPGLLPWASPIIAAYVLAVPFAVFTTSSWAGRNARRIGICRTPEEVLERSDSPVVEPFGILGSDLSRAHGT